MTGYKYPLKVCTPSGKRVVAKITQLSKGEMLITSPYLKEVELDNPTFSKNGRVSIQYSKTEQTTVVEKVTSYLENLFLQELSKNETGNNSSIKSGSNKGGDSPKPTRKPKAKSKGYDPSRLHDSRGGDQQT